MTDPSPVHGVRRRRLALQAVALAVLVGVAARRWQQMGPYPPGLDEANWLAIGRAYAGESMTTLRALYPPSIMPPLVPGLMYLLSEVGGPMAAARLLSAGSLLAVMAAVYSVAARGANPPAGLCAALITGCSLSIQDPASWGGYPQNLAVAGIVVGNASLAGFLRTGGWGAAVGTVGGHLLVGLSHHAFGGVSCTLGAVAWGAWLLERPPRHVVVRRTAFAAALYVPGTIGFLVALVSLGRSGYDPAVNAGGATYTGTLTYLLYRPAWLWVTIAVGGAAGLVATWSRDPRPPAWTSSVTALAVSLGGFALTVEPRFLALAVTSLSVGAALGLHRAWGQLRSGPWAGVPIGVPIFLAGVLLPFSDERAEASFAFYHYADRSLVDTASWIDTQHVDGKIAVRSDSRGWPVGWWLRGLTAADVIVGSDPRWLGFSSERDEAALVASLFEGEMDPQEVSNRARATGVELLVFRQDEWIGWQRWFERSDGPLSKVFDDGHHMVVAVRAP